MRLQEKELVIGFDIYPCVVIVVKTNDIGKSRKKRSKKFGKPRWDEYPNTNAVTEVALDERFIYIFYHSADAGSIAHESYHAILRVFEYIGVEKKDEEQVAYMLEYIVNKTINFLNDTTNNTCNCCTCSNDTGSVPV